MNSHLKTLSNNLDNASGGKKLFTIIKKEISDTSYQFEDGASITHAFEKYLNTTSLDKFNWLKKKNLESKSTSSENDTQGEAIQALKARFENRVLQLARGFQLEQGELSDLDLEISERIQEKSLSTSWINDELNRLFLKHFTNLKVCTSIIRFFSKLPYNEACPNGPTIALAAFSHKDLSVAEEALKAFDIWGSKESLNLLENTQVQNDWLAEYKSEIIEDIRAN